MSAAQHTPGPLTVEPWHDVDSDHGGWNLVTDGHLLPLCDMEAGEDDDPEANARRLALCWNACNGIPSSVLEDVPGVVEATLPYHRLKAQRDALLAALRELLDCHLTVSDIAVIRSARAAILKAEGSGT